jgi:hypothetical protein
MRTRQGGRCGEGAVLIRSVRGGGGALIVAELVHPLPEHGVLLLEGERDVGLLRLDIVPPPRVATLLVMHEGVRAHAHNSV